MHYNSFSKVYGCCILTRIKFLSLIRKVQQVELLHACEHTTVVADYFAWQKFRGLATQRDTQIFRGGNFR